MFYAKDFFVRAEWDQEAVVWVATSDDVPGLVAEAETLEALSAKLEILVPELLDANGVTLDAEVPYELLARRFYSGAAGIFSGRVFWVGAAVGER